MSVQFNLIAAEYQPVQSLNIIVKFLKYCYVVKTKHFPQHVLHHTVCFEFRLI